MDNAFYTRWSRAVNGHEGASAATGAASDAATRPLAPLPFACSPLRELRAGEVAQFHLSARRPEAVVIRGIARDWPATRRLAAAGSDAARVDVLRRLCPIGYAPFTEHRRGYLHYGADYRRADWSFASRVTTFSSFARRLLECSSTSEGAMVYMQGVPIRLFPGLRRAIDPVPWLGAEFAPPCTSTVWIGSGDHIINTHLDFKNNLICMLTGVKRFIVAPPDAASSLYLAAIDRGVGGAISSLARLLEFDTSRFPKLTDAVGQMRSAVLGPGDAIYLPPCWWHHVESYGLNVMVNAWRAVLPPAVERQWLLRLERSIAWMSELDSSTKAALRGVLRGTASSATAELLLPPAQRQHLQAHLQDTRALYRDVGPHFRHVGELLHDYYVFDAFGPPVPLPDRARPAMVQRLRERLEDEARHPVRSRVHRVLRGFAQSFREISDWPVPRVKHF